MCTGDKYPFPEYVLRLRSMVARNLTVPHRFICITDFPLNPGGYPQAELLEADDIEWLKPPTDLPGWWGKLGLFKPGFATGMNLWLDLDVVITGSLDILVDYLPCALATPWNWAQSGHGGCQSSVMLWYGDGPRSIYDSFDHSDAHWPPRNDNGKLWGDQEWITVCRDNGFPVTEIEPGLVVSYKYHCRTEGKSPDNARVVVFHGEPNPSDCHEQWIKDAWC